MDCGLLTAGIAADCNNPLVAGIKDRMILMNASEISALTRNVGNPQIVEAVTKVAGKVGFVFEGQRSSNNAKSTFVKGKYSGGYTHSVDFIALGNSSAIKAQLEKLGPGRVVAFIENNFKGGDSTFEIMGLDLGLILDAMTSDKNDADTQGGYTITLQTQDGFREPHLPATLFDTDYATTKALFEGLLS